MTHFHCPEKFNLTHMNLCEYILHFSVPKLIEGICEQFNIFMFEICECENVHSTGVCVAATIVFVVFVD